jgi:hypothetical protein
VRSCFPAGSIGIFCLEKNFYAPIFINCFSFIFQHPANGSVRIHSPRVPKKLESTLLVDCSRVGIGTFLVVRRMMKNSEFGISFTLSPLVKD